MISTFIINIKSRKERRESIESEFQNKKKQYDIRIIDAIEDINGAKGLWLTIQYIINKYTKKETDYILICEDDHEFTNHYTYTKLIKNIEESIELNAEILLGGISWSKSIIKHNNIYWVEEFNGTQFMILFNKVFEKIKKISFEEGDHADIKLSNLLKKKYVIYPFISVQKEFGYSDITQRNSEKGMLKKLFEDSAYNINMSTIRENYYIKIKSETKRIYTNFSIPAYIYNSKKESQHQDLLDSLKARNEFIIRNILNKDDKENINFSKAIKIIITTAINNDDDVIIILLDNFSFNRNYGKKKLANNIRLAHNCECDIIIGNVSFDFDYAIPINSNLIWLKYFNKTLSIENMTYLIIFKKFYKKIIDTHEDINYSLVNCNNIMTLHPPISNTNIENKTITNRLNNLVKQFKKNNV